MQVHSIKSGFCIGKRLNPNFLETKSKMADADNFAFTASSLEFPGRDHVIPGSFVSGLGNPRVFWPGIRDPRRFYSGIWETGSREYKSKLPSFPRRTSDFALVRTTRIFFLAVFILLWS